MTKEVDSDWYNRMINEKKDAINWDAYDTCDADKYPVGSKVVIVRGLLPFDPYVFGIVIKATATTRTVNIVSATHVDPLNIQMGGPFTCTVVQAKPQWDKVVETHTFRYSACKYNKTKCFRESSPYKGGLLAFLAPYNADCVHCYTTDKTFGKLGH